MKIWIKFSPLLIAYICIVFVGSKDHFWHDEVRYVNFATNLSNGYYSPPEEINLKNGPGYPLILLPFVFCKAPWIFAKLLNAFFLFAAVYYFYNTVRIYLSEKKALYIALALGLYPPFLRFLPILITEITAVFLMCGFVYHFCKAKQNTIRVRMHLGASSIYLGYLVLTKVFFGYVLLIGLIIYMLLKLVFKSPRFNQVILVHVFALILCLPYLFYTWHLTGKPGYWGSRGGMSLYWMSSPYPNDLGDWHSFKQVKKVPELAQNHSFFINRVETLNEIDQDIEFKKKALNNIIESPCKYAKNWIMNLGRLFFNYPFSYTRQKPGTFLFILPNSLFLILGVQSCFLMLRSGMRLVMEMKILLLFCAVSFAGLSILSAYGRFFIPFAPILALCISYIYNYSVKIQN